MCKRHTPWCIRVRHTFLARLNTTRPVAPGESVHHKVVLSSDRWVFHLHGNYIYAETIRHYRSMTVTCKHGATVIVTTSQDCTVTDVDTQTSAVSTTAIVTDMETISLSQAVSVVVTQWLLPHITPRSLSARLPGWLRNPQPSTRDRRTRPILSTAMRQVIRSKLARQARHLPPTQKQPL